MTTVKQFDKERIRKIHESFIALMWISTRRFVQRLQPFSLTKPQFITLMSLAAHKKPCTMSDLTSITFQDAPTMTGIVDRLVKMKLVQRSRSETDRRVVLVQIAPGGTDLIQQIEETILHDACSDYAALADEELIALEQLIIYLTRMHIGRYKAVEGADLEAEIRKLRQFMHDPILYAKLEDEQTPVLAEA